LRYISRISSFDARCSRASDISISFALRAGDQVPVCSSALNSSHRKNMRESCWVIVLPPRGRFRSLKMSVITNFAALIGFNPGCE
jgi:hypothetical protein